MAFRNDVIFPILTGAFQEFDQGNLIYDWVPNYWNLHPGDTMGYEAESNIRGVVKVIAITGEIRNFEEECVFQKTNY